MAAKNKQLDKVQKISLLVNENAKLLDDLIKQIIDNSPKKLLVVSDNRIVYANPKSVKSLGLKPKDYKDIPVNEAIVSSQGGFQLSQYLALSASLRKNISDKHIVKLAIGNSREKWYLPSLRRSFWRGKSSILISLDEVNLNGSSAYDNVEYSQRCKLAINATAQFVWDYSVNSDNLFISSELFSSLGYKPNESEGDPSFWLNKLHPDYQNGFTNILEKLKQIGRAHV